MSTVVNKIEQILTSEYSTANFVELMQEIFDSMKLVAPNNFKQEFSNFSTHIVGKAHVGNYTTPEGKKIAIFSVQLKKENYVESSRSTQRSYAKKLIEGGNCDAAIVAFYTEGEPKWRLSFVRLDYEMKIEQGKLKTTENITPAKRYSFLVGKDEPSHTAIDRFRQFIIDRNANPTLDELEEAFSVEKVTKEFFELYCEKFYQLQEYLESNEDFVEEFQRCGFTSEQFAKKLLGQVVFLYFLQKKGWLGVNVWAPSITEKEFKDIYYTGGAQGRIIKEHLPKIYVQQPDGSYRLNSRVLDTIPDDEEEVIANHMVRRKTWGDGSKKFLRTIFEHSKTHKGHFFENYLEPLFYDTLNRNRGSMGYCPALHARVPFLSGGLFEPLDSYDWKSNHFDIPDEIFSNKKDANDRSATGILDIFDRYNFTMSEDEPMEREVAIDPEMLGKIFENLLEVRDRKSKGAFYTPREIVHYMCQESLVNYLIRKTGLPEDALRDFILYGDFMKDEDTVKSKREGNGGMLISPEIFKIDENGNIVVNRLKDIDDALATVRVADPAVGSGAFPLGMVNEIVRARENITAYITIGMNANRKRLLYKNERSPYALKYNAIRNSIFAVDIEPSAVDITQLRLWLSLVIDDEITPDAANDLEGHKNPLPLPNLECNILCGNSLIDEFKGIKLVKESDILGTMSAGVQMDFGHAGFEAIVKQLLKVQDELFVCDEPHKKAELKEQVQSLKDMIVSEQLAGCADSIKTEYDSAVRRSSKPFTLWHLDFARVFRDNGGFDIVIGNPPYVGEKGNKEIFRPIAATEFGKRCYYGKMDLFYFFFHKALDLGNDEAEIAFITTNYFPTAFGGKLLRKDFKSRTQIRRLINFNELKIFESALGQHNMITMLTKCKTSIAAHNSLCKVSGVADSNLLKSVLYSMENSDFFDVRVIEQDNLYDGEEDYIRLMGCASSSDCDNLSVLSKIAASDKLLVDIAIIKQGIVSGADKYTDAHEAKFGLGFPKGKGIFVLPKIELEDIPLSLQERERYVKQVYKNSQISRYHIEYSDNLYVFYITKEVKETDAPNIIAHLRHFKPILESKREAVEGKLPWYSLHWARDRDVFEAKEKIVNSRRAKSNIFALEERAFFEQSDIMVTVIKPECAHNFPPKYILGILNSKLYYYWLKNRGKLKGDMLELYGKPLEEIPIKKPSKENARTIVTLVEQIIENRTLGKDTQSLETELDYVIFNMYGLSEDEISLVEAECR